MLNIFNIPHFSKIAFFLMLSLYLTGCGEPEQSDWFSYNSRDRQNVSVRVLAADVLPGTEKKDIIRIKMEWRNDDNERIVIDDEKFSLNVSGEYIP